MCTPFPLNQFWGLEPDSKLKPVLWVLPAIDQDVKQDYEDVNKESIIKKKQNNSFQIYSTNILLDVTYKWLFSLRAMFF